MKTEIKDEKAPRAVHTMPSKAGKKEANRKQDDGWGGHHGYMKEKERKLEEQFLGLNDHIGKSKRSEIFSGICIFVNGYTNPSSDHLKQIMADHGGRYQHYYSMRSCTHIIATNLPDSKVRDLKNKKVVHPDWILDSVAAGICLPIDEYQLYSNTSGTRKSAFANFRSNFDGSEDVAINDCISSHAQSTSLKECGDSNIGLLAQDTEAQEAATCSRSEAFAMDKSMSAGLSTQKEDGVHCNGSLRDDICWKKNKRAILEPSSSQSKSIGICSNESKEKATESSKGFERIDANDAECDTKHSHSIVRGGLSSTGHDDDARKNESFLTSSVLSQWQGDEDVEDLFECNQSEIYNGARAHKTSNDQLSLPKLTKHDYSPEAHAKTMGKAGDPGFMGDFYSNSRLHHLSMWKSELKRFATMINSASSKKRLTEVSSKKSGRCIMHIDMDSFFVSVALKEKPELIGKPIAVCHASKASSSVNMNSMSEIASCSYEARSMGVRNGMFLGAARVKCPELVCVPYYFESYRTVSQKFYEVLASYTCNIEAVSCDEALLDISDLIGEELSALELSTKIRNEIQEATGCTASAGIAGNILLARMATRRAKPNGQFHLQKSDITEFLECQKALDLPGVGRSLHSKLMEIGVTTCGDLKQISLHDLQSKFGSRTGQSLFNHCRGIDDRQLKTSHERQSVSAEINYGIRFTEQHESQSFLNELAKEVHERLRAIEMKGRHITLKLMIRAKGAPEPLKHMGHGICDNFSKSATISQPTDDSIIIAKETINLLQQLNVSASDIRGMGIQISKLVQVGSSSKSMQRIDFSRARPLNVDAKLSGDVSNGRSEKSIVVKEKEMPLKGKSVVKKRGKKPAQKSSRTIGDMRSVINNFTKRVGNPHGFVGQSRPLDSIELKGPPLPSFNLSPANQRVDKHIKQFDLPPVSEIDPAVFNELPNDVKESIAEAYKQRNQSLDIRGSSLHMPKVDWSPSSRSNQSKRKFQGTASHISKRKRGGMKTLKDENRLATSVNFSMSHSNEKEKDRKGLDNTLNSESGGVGCEIYHQKKEERAASSSRSEEVLSESRIDPEVMEALPEDLRNEVLMSIKLEKSRREVTYVAGVVANDRRRLDESDRIARSKQSVTSGFGRAERDPQNDSCKNQGVFASKTCVESSESVLESIKSHGANQRHPSIGGKSSYEEMKVLFKEWINSTDEPCSEDVEEVRLYLEGLVYNRNMEQAFLLLKLLRRLSSKSKEWMNYWTVFEKHFEQLIKNLYGAKLYL